MSTQTFYQLFVKYPRTLTTLKTNELLGRCHENLPPLLGSSLANLEVRTVQVSSIRYPEWRTWPAVRFVRNVLGAVKFNKLVLGDERWTWASGRADGPHKPYFEQMPLLRLLRGFMEIGGLSSLHQLDLIGVKVTGSVPEDSLLDFYRLTRLSLESCPGTSDLLAVLTRNADRVKLKELKIREEKVPLEVMRNLEVFLSSFTGLELLSVLLDNASETMNYRGFMQSHGATLKVLVWECRKRNRTLAPFDLETSSDDGPAFIEELCKTCTKLEELSIALDMRLQYENTIKCNRIKSLLPFQVLTLPNLKTFHSRILPSASRLGVSREFVMQANKAIVSMYISWGYFTLGTKCNLELVAVGSPSYSDRWLQSHTMRAYEENTTIATPIFFDVGITQDSDLLNKHKLSCIGKFNQAKKSFVCDGLDEIKESYAYTRVFDSYWLR